MGELKGIIISALVGAIGSVVAAVFFLGGEWSQWKVIRDEFNPVKEAGESHMKGHVEGENLSNMVAFFAQGKCPDETWEVMASLEGRYVVGTSGENGGFGETQGIPLKPLENRAVGQHSHEVTNAGVHNHKAGATGEHRHSFDGARPHDSGAGDHGRAKPSGQSRNTGASGNHSHPISDSGNHTHTIGNQGSVAGTVAPYIQLLACRKR